MKKILAAAVLLAFSFAAHADAFPSYPFVHVSGSAELQVLPDTGEIDFEVVSTDQDPEAAWKRVELRLSESRALFAQHGIEAGDIEVQDITRRIRKDQGTLDGQPVVETKAAVHVTVRNLSAWTAIVEPLMKMADVDAFAVVFSHSERDKIAADLVVEALKDARRKADNVARGVGRRLGLASAVSTSPLKNLSNSFGLSTDFPLNRGVGVRSKPDSVDHTLVAAIKLVQNVDVLYRFK